MKTGARFREPVRVVMHLDAGVTRVALERTGGSGMAGGEVCWDLPTELIPQHLRAIGSRFLVVKQALHPEPHDPPEAIRAAARDLAIEELSELE